MRTRLASALVASIFALPLVLAACGGSDDPPDDEPFDTFQECFDDHHSGDEGFSIPEAITVCCLDHPIAGVVPSCGNTIAQCQMHVDMVLSQTSASTDEILDGCTEYIADK